MWVSCEDGSTPVNGMCDASISGSEVLLLAFRMLLLQDLTDSFHIQEKYPDSVYLSEGTCSHCMEIRNARLPG